MFYLWENGSWTGKRVNHLVHYVNTKCLQRSLICKISIPVTANELSGNANSEPHFKYLFRDLSKAIVTNLLFRTQKHITCKVHFWISLNVMSFFLYHIRVCIRYLIHKIFRPIVLIDISNSHCIAKVPRGSSIFAFH